jgi:hypothetical protein
VYHLDAHALYPSLLASLCELPRARLGYRDMPPRGFAEWLTATHCVIAEVEIETAEPLAPYQARPGAPVVWPVGRWRTTLCGPELASSRLRVPSAVVPDGMVRQWTDRPQLRRAHDSPAGRAGRDPVRS